MSSADDTLDGPMPVDLHTTELTDPTFALAAAAAFYRAVVEVQQICDTHVAALKRRDPRALELSACNMVAQLSLATGAIHLLDQHSCDDPEQLRVARAALRGCGSLLVYLLDQATEAATLWAAEGVDVARLHTVLKRARDRIEPKQRAGSPAAG